MMSHKKLAIPALAFLLAWSFLLTGCTLTSVAVGHEPRYHHGPPGGGPPPWAPAHGYRAKYTYRYYPSLQIYYDLNRELYFYFSDGQWRASARAPVTYRSKRGDSVVLHMTTGRPYHHHQDVLKRYPPGQAKGKGRGR